MDHLNSTTYSHIKGKHLTFAERVIIELRCKDKCSIRSIAREIGCSPTTVSNEIKRGTVLLYRGHVKRYKALAGQKAYENNKHKGGRKYAYLSRHPFIRYVINHFFEEGWSLDACFGRALSSGKFNRTEIVCTKTLYNYVDKGLISIRNHNLPEKLSRSTKKHHVRINKRKLGRSIEERPPETNLRQEFGHWECDLVLGAKTKDDNVLLTLLERKSREYLIVPLENKEASTVVKAFRKLRSKYGKHFDDIFKTITTDNGSEFADLTKLESVADTLVYYAHPYASCEKGSIERHNGLIRRFIPKGKRIDQFSAQAFTNVQDWINCLPRKLLKYRTPDEVFEEELDAIYRTA